MLTPMIGKLTGLPLRAAKRIARLIQEQDARRHAQDVERERAEATPEPVREQIPAHELPDLPPSAVALDMAQLRALPSPCVVDVRGAARWAAGHPRGAVHMPEVEVLIRLAELPPDVPVVAVDDGDGAAVRAALFMRGRGLESVYALTGGFAAWQAGGGALDRQG